MKIDIDTSDVNNPLVEMLFEQAFKDFIKIVQPTLVDGQKNGVNLAINKEVKNTIIVRINWDKQIFQLIYGVRVKDGNTLLGEAGEFQLKSVAEHLPDGSIKNIFNPSLN